MYRVDAQVRPERFGVRWHLIVKPKCFIYKADVSDALQKEFQRVLVKKLLCRLVGLFKFYRVLKMAKNEEHFRHISFFLPLKGKNSISLD